MLSGFDGSLIQIHVQSWDQRCRASKADGHGKRLVPWDGGQCLDGTRNCDMSERCTMIQLTVLSHRQRELVRCADSEFARELSELSSLQYYCMTRELERAKPQRGLWGPDGINRALRKQPQEIKRKRERAVEGIFVQSTAPPDTVQSQTPSPDDKPRNPISWVHGCFEDTPF